MGNITKAAGTVVKNNVFIADYRTERIRVRAEKLLL
jgi:hypothetical protein